MQGRARRSSEAGPAPISATFLPFGLNGPCGISVHERRPCCPRRHVSAGRSRQVLLRRGPRRQAGSHGRSQVRPRIPGNTFESQLIMYASVYFPSAIRRIYSGTGVCAGHAYWQSTTLWKYSGSFMSVGFKLAFLCVSKSILIECRITFLVNALKSKVEASNIKLTVRIANRSSCI